MPFPLQLLRRARPYLTPGFNPNDDEQQGNVLSLLTRGLYPQEAVQPQVLQRMPAPAAPVSMNPGSWDKSDIGGRPFNPDGGPRLVRPAPQSNREQVVLPEQPRPSPLTRQFPDDLQAAMPAPSMEAGVPQVRNQAMPDSSLGTELANPRMLQRMPTDIPSVEQSDRTLGIGEAETNYLNQLASQKLVDRNGRLKSGLKRLLPGLIQGGLPGAVAEFLTGVVDPKWDERRARAEEFGIHSGNLERYNQQADSDLKRRYMTSQAAENETQAQNAPLVAQQAREERERDNIRQIYQSLPEFDPQTNPEHKQIADRATQLGLTLPKKAKPVTHHKTLTFRSKNGIQEPGYADEETGTFTPLKDEKGEPVKREPKPSNVGADGLTAYQRLRLDLRRQGVTYQKNKDQKREQQGQQQFLDGTSRYYATRLADAAKIAQQFDEKMASALAETDKSKRDYWLAAAESYRQQLAAYNDVYETGQSKGTDGTMWGYAKPKVGKSVRAVMQGLGTKDPDEAVRYILDQGYVPVR